MQQWSGKVSERCSLCTWVPTAALLTDTLIHDTIRQQRRFTESRPTTLVNARPTRPTPCDTATSDSRDTFSL